jgi:hypothetical protein
VPQTDDNERMTQGTPEEAARRERWARSRIFELPDLASADDVTAMGDSIVDALTTEFAIEEVPPPRPGEEPADRTVALPAVDANAVASRNDERADAEDGTSEPTQPAARAPQAHDSGATLAVPAATQADGAKDDGAAATAALPRVKAQPPDDGIFEGADITAEEEEAYWSNYSAEDALFGPDGIGDVIDDRPDEPQRDELPDSPAVTAVMEPIGDLGEPAVTVERHRPRLHISAGKIVAAICIVLVLSLVGGGAAFAWDRWYRYDDIADIQGEWQIANSQRTLVIDESNLKIDADVAYEYTIDPKAKTITYTFGDTTGTATYRFAKDRDTLIIDENMETDWLVALHLKGDAVLAADDVPEGVSKLKRLSRDTAAEPQTMGGNAGEGDAGMSASDPFYVEGYTDLTQTEVVKPATNSDKDKDKDKDKNGNGESSEGEDSKSTESDSEKQGASTDPDAAYTDEETGMSYYFDDSQQLYYDMYGNYYYDMYGQNPYTAPVETYDDGTGLSDADTYYDDGTATGGDGYY